MVRKARGGLHARHRRWSTTSSCVTRGTTSRGSRRTRSACGSSAPRPHSTSTTSCPGQDWIDRILDLLPSSRICVVFVSQHSSKAIVQRNEAFLARYLARDQPDRHQVVPVYLEGAPPQSNIHGLETTSGFREDRESLEEIAQGLVTQLRGMGDSADRTTRTIGMIDEVAWRWLFPPEHDFAARYRVEG